MHLAWLSAVQCTCYPHQLSSQVSFRVSFRKYHLIMPIELCPVAIRVCGKGVRRGKGAGSGFVPYGGKGGKGDGKNGGGAGHAIVAAGGADGAPLAVPPLFNTTNLRVSFKDSTQPDHVEMTFEVPGSVVVPPSIAVWGDPVTDPGRVEGVSAVHIGLLTTDHPGSLDITIEIEGAGEDETEHLITEVTISRRP